MALLYLLSIFLTLFINIILINYILKNIRKKEDKSVNWLYLILIPYLFQTIFHFLWQVNVFPYSEGDFNLIFAITLLMQTIALYKIHNLSNKKISLYYLTIYLLTFFSFYLADFNFFIITISLILTLILSLNYLSYLTERKVAYFGILYSSVSLIFQFLNLFNKVNILFYSLISNFIFVFFIYKFLKNIKEDKIKKIEFSNKDEPKIILFVKYLIYIIAISNLVLISTLGLHEFGHVAISRLYNCEARSIFYEEKSYPYSEIVCDDLSGKLLISLAGPIIPIIFSLFLLIIGGKFIKSLSFIIIGFNLLASFKDLTEIGLSINLVFGISSLGILSLFYGIYLLAISRVEETTNYST